MVTINGITDGVSFPPPKNSSNSTVDETFGNTLKKVLEENGETKTTQTTMLAEINQPAMTAIYDSVEEFTSMTTDLLDLLEEYANELEDPEKNLKDLEPKIRDILEGAESLMKEAKKGSVTDDGLLKIAEEAAMTANLEYVRYNRGDYI